MKEVTKTSIDPEIVAEYSKLYHKFEVALNQRISLPFSCLVFGLFGIPLGLRPQRTNTSIGLGLSLVFILFYYVLMTLGRSLGINGVMSPLLAAWLPNIVFGVIGIVLFIRARRT